MSTAARVFQVLFMVLGFFFLGFGLLGGSLSVRDDVELKWTCTTDATSPGLVNCASRTGYVENVSGSATVYTLFGVGLEVAAVAVAAGSRQTSPAGPIAPPFRPNPSPASGYPSYPVQPPGQWSAG